MFSQVLYILTVDAPCYGNSSFEFSLFVFILKAVFLFKFQKKSDDARCSERRTCQGPARPDKAKKHESTDFEI